MAWFKHTVDSILGEFHDIHERLLDHSQAKFDEAVKADVKANEHLNVAQAARHEAQRAVNVASKIAELVK